jgi:hypothetical protein
MRGLLQRRLIGNGAPNLKLTNVGTVSSGICRVNPKISRSCINENRMLLVFSEYNAVNGWYTSNAQENGARSIFRALCRKRMLY